MEQIMFDQSLSATIGRLSVPTLLVYGKDDLVAPPEVGEFIYKTIMTKSDEKKLVIMKESRHGAEGNDIQFFQNELIQFIDEWKK
jgi:esterase/lipase